MARWSQDSVTLIIVAATIWPPRTTARSSPVPTARIEDCGGLITAVKSLMPNMPRLDTEVAPPWYSFGFSFLDLARAANSFISLEIAEIDLISAWRMIGVIRPNGKATATPMSECLWRSIADSVHDTLASGTFCSATAMALMTKSLTDSL